MEKELKAINDAEIEKTIAESFDKLVGGCKCKLISRSYPKPEKAILKIEIRQIENKDIVLAIKGSKGGEGKIEL